MTPSSRNRETTAPSTRSVFRGQTGNLMIDQSITGDPKRSQASIGEGAIAHV